MKNIRFAYIGCFVSENDAKINPAFSLAANLYQEKLMAFIEPEISLSILPMFINQKVDFSYFGNVKFINNQSGLPHKINKAFRFFADTCESIFHLIFSKCEIFLFYNVDRQNFLIIIFVKFILRKRTFAVAADFVEVELTVVDSMIKWLYGKLDGAIVLNSNIHCNSKMKLLPGLIYDYQIKKINNNKLSRQVLMSGSLGKTTGLELALEFFSKNESYDLYITGKPFRYNQEDFDKLINYYTLNFKNIHFLGVLGYEEYLSVMLKCDVALSLRNPEDEEHLYNFPSKILEYLSNSKIVVSTLRYPDIPSQYIFYSEFNIESLSLCLEKIFSLNECDVKDYRESVFGYLNCNFTKDSFIKLLGDLINE